MRIWQHRINASKSVVWNIPEWQYQQLHAVYNQTTDEKHCNKPNPDYPGTFQWVHGFELIALG